MSNIKKETYFHSQTKYRILKFMSSIYFFLLLPTILTLLNSPAKGFEMSIYESTPLFSWVIIFGGILLGIIIIINEAFEEKPGNFWIIGLFMILCSNLLLTSVWNLRGYFSWASNDFNAHYGMTIDLITKNHVGEYNFYPLLHLLIAQIKFVCGFSLNKIMNYLPSFLVLFYTFFMVGLARTLIKNNKKFLFVIAALAPLMFGFYSVTTYPRGLGQILLAFALIFFVRTISTNLIQDKILLLILVVTAMFTHPLAIIAFFVLFVAAEISKYFKIKFDNPKNVILKLRKIISVNYIFFTFIGFSAWIMQFFVFDFNVVLLYRVLIGAQKEPVWLSRALSMMELDLYHRILFFLKLYGTVFIYGSICGVFFIFLFWDILKKKRMSQTLSSLMVWIILADILGVIFMLTLSGGALVETSKVALLSPLFVGLAFHRFVSNKNKIFIKKSIIISIIFVTVMVGGFAVYRSPYLYQVNPQMTYSDFTGTAWVIDNRIASQGYSGVGVPYSIPFLLIGEEAVDITRSDLQVILTRIALYPYTTQDVPADFNYDEYETFGEQFAYDRPLILTKRLKMVLVDPILQEQRGAMGPNFGRWDFDISSFNLLYEDPTVQHIYSNGELEIFYVEGTRNPHIKWSQ